MNSPPISRGDSEIGPGPANADKRSSAFATASVVLALLWIGGLGSLLAVVFGVVALFEIRSNRHLAGKRLAVIGTVVGGIGLVLTIVLAGVLIANLDFLDRVRFDEVWEGDCIVPDEKSDNHVRYADCDDPGAEEAFAVERIFASQRAPWPGQAAADSLAQRACARRADGEFRFHGLSQRAWTKGHRTVLCVYADPAR